MKRKIISLLMMMAMVLSLVPGASFAKSNDDTDRVKINIYGFDRIHDTVDIFMTGAEDGDQYMVYLNNDLQNPIAQGTLSVYNHSARVSLEKAKYPVLKDLDKRDILRVRVGAAGFGGIVGAQSAAFYGATQVTDTLDVYPKQLVEGKKDQSVTLYFDEDYVPGKDDVVRFVAYDKDGKLLGKDKSESFNITDKVLHSNDRDNRMKVYISPDKDVAYYEVQFVSGGNNIVNDLTKKVEVLPNYKDIKKLVIKFPSDKVKIGETVKPEYYFLDEKDNKVPVRGEIVFNVSSAGAIENKSTKDGSFTVKDDQKYVGQHVTVTAISGTFSDTASLTITTKDGKTEVAPEVPQLTVIMGINSSDLLVNGVKKPMDAVPVIQSNRTFVPLRALAEAFGAKVEYTHSNQSISIAQGNKVVVMLVGSKNYTLNGAAKTMDVAPYIHAASGRTMVPVRFAAEALGYSVEASYHNDGTTSNVVFTNMEKTKVNISGAK